MNLILQTLEKKTQYLKYHLLRLETCFLPAAIIKPFLVFFQIFEDYCYLNSCTRYSAKPHDSPLSRMDFCVGEGILIYSRKSLQVERKDLGAQRWCGAGRPALFRQNRCLWLVKHGDWLLPVSCQSLHSFHYFLHAVVRWRPECRQQDT